MTSIDCDKAMNSCTHHNCGLNLGCLHPVACVRSGDGVFYIPLCLRYEPNRLMLSICLWRCYINITITVLGIILRPELQVCPYLTGKTLHMRYESNRIMLYTGLWRCFINITITFLDIIHRPVFYIFKARRMMTGWRIMSRIVTVTLIYRRHKPTDLNNLLLLKLLDGRYYCIVYYITCNVHLIILKVWI
jgi:hypothetical protein